MTDLHDLFGNVNDLNVKPFTNDELITHNTKILQSLHHTNSLTLSGSASYPV